MNPLPELVPDMLTFEMFRSRDAFDEIDMAHVVQAVTWRHEPSGVAVTFSGDENTSNAMTVEDRNDAPGIGWTVGIAAVPSITDIDPAAGMTAAALALVSAWHTFEASGFDESESGVHAWGAGIAAIVEAESGATITGVGFPTPYDETPKLKVIDNRLDIVDHPVVHRLNAIAPTSLHVVIRGRLITLGRSIDPRDPEDNPDNPVTVLRTVAEIKARLAARDGEA